MPRGDERERAEVREHDGGEGNDSRPEELRDFRFQVSEQSKAQPRAGAGPVQGSIVGDRIDSAANDTGVIVQAEIGRSEEHTSELQSLMRISYAVFCLKKKTI